MKLKVIHERHLCIGCAACACLEPELWEMNPDGKSDVRKPTRTKKTDEEEIQEKEISTREEYEKHKNAAQACPVNCIHVEKEGKREL